MPNLNKPDISRLKLWIPHFITFIFIPGITDSLVIIPIIKTERRNLGWCRNHYNKDIIFPVSRYCYCTVSVEHMYLIWINCKRSFPLIELPISAFPLRASELIQKPFWRMSELVNMCLDGYKCSPVPGIKATMAATSQVNEDLLTYHLIFHNNSSHPKWMLSLKPLMWFINCKRNRVDSLQ